MSTRIRTLEFLPEIFQTPTNAQFLAATLDQLVAQPTTKKIEGYIGSKLGYGINANDHYVTEPTKTRTDYQLDPGVVFTHPNESTARDFITYPGIIDSLKIEGSLVGDNSRLFESQFYSWDSFTNLDKLINFNEYYWIPQGPEAVVISTDTIYSTNDYVVTDQPNGYLISIVGSTAGAINPTLTLLRGGTYTFAVNQSSSFWIQGEPGVSGYSSIVPNQYVRDVYGVENNGADTGLITFNVPDKTAQDQYNFPGNNPVDVVCTVPFDQINGKRLSEIGSVDSLTSLNGLTVMFYNTGVIEEQGYISAFFDATEVTATSPGNYDQNIGLVAPQTVSVTATYSLNDTIQCSSVANLVVGQTITFSGVPFGNLQNLVYYIVDINAGTSTIKISLTLGGDVYHVPDDSGYMIGNINQGLYEEGYYTLVQDNFYAITYVGDLSDPTIRLIPAGLIPSNEKIIPTYGKQWIGLPFYKNSINGAIALVPYISAPLNTLYYQDGTAPNKVGVINLIESNYTNTLNVEVDILGKKNYTSSTGVVFTNGLKVKFEGDIIPTSYKTGEYYVEGVGTAIELIAANDLVVPEPFTSAVYIPWDISGWDMNGWEGDSYIPVTPDYITIARNSINRNGWSRSNRWFHIDVINATAQYNNAPNLVSLYATQDNKAKRPIIEFYPNLRLFDSGSQGKKPVDFVDLRTTDAFSYVAGQENYYPDVAVYTSYAATIAPAIASTSTTVSIPASDITGTFQLEQYISDSTNLLPRNSRITEISGTTTIVLTVSWNSIETFAGTSTASIIATDTTNDNYALFDGSRVVFAADTNLEVRNKIYISRYSYIDSSGIPVITLTEAADGDVLPDQQVVSFRGYNTQGVSYFFDGDIWHKAQTKTQLNQPPLFDVFDKDGISFGNSDVYLGTSFIGNKLFAYGLGSGLDDAILGFPLAYSAVNNIGDISFDVSLNSATFNYVVGQIPKTQKVNTGYVYNYNTRIDYVRELGWKTAVSPSVQYQVFEFKYDILTRTPVNYVCDVAMAPTSSTNWPVIQVFINNEIQTQDVDFTVTTTSNSTTVVLASEPVISTMVQVLLLSDQVSRSAYYTIPINLNNNPFNADVTTVNVGDLRGQYQSIFYNNPNTSGVMFGANNTRDLGNLVPWGTKIIQNSASLVLPGAFLREPNHNLFNAIQYNSTQYINFKTLLVDTINNTNYTQRFDPATMLDDALDQITLSKTNTQPFFWSDMVPSKAPYAINTYSFNNSMDVSVYQLNTIYDFSNANYKGVLVYLTRTTNNITHVQQLINNQDYIISNTSPTLTVTLDLLPGDKITIKEYNQTYGSYVPNTPTKLGLYPAFIPTVILDSDYAQPTWFIRGHDGSYNKLYGEYDPITGILIDFRDQALLEFELRIYNNLKLSAEIPIPATEILPGFFRETDYTYDEIMQIYSTAFLSWVGQNRVRYKTQYYNRYDEFTYNYNLAANKINQEQILQGYWRGIYSYFYDTSTPNNTPWEMIGYTDQPSWWTSRYGAAPYTSDNLILWGDLAAGYDWNNGSPVIKPEYVRPQLLKILPVDDQGNLLSPFISIVGNYNGYALQRDWKVGDDGPTEFSYRRSSTWPFDLMRILALTKPAKFYNLGVDLDNYKYNEEFNQYLVNDRHHLIISDVEVYGSGIPKTSYVNWIVDYEKQVGIDATVNISTMFDNLDVRLVYRLAGFSDQSLLKFYVEKSTANSNNSSLLIPDESYSVLLYDNQPFTKIVYSGVVVQLVENGLAVYGNSQSTAYFNILSPGTAKPKEDITVEKLTVTVPSSFTDNVIAVPYGTVFYSIEEVAQFLACYGAYLNAQGMKFEQIENGIPITWNQMIAEFLYWAQTGWEKGSIVTLNPAATNIVIDRDGYIVQPLTMRETNFILNQNLYPIQFSDLSIVRDNTLFSVKPVAAGDALSYGQFNIQNIEHGIVFNNVTLFNDVLYNLITGLRQLRITVRGTKTADWNGIINAAGFILNQNNIQEWNKNVKYTKGIIVRYKNKYWTSLKVQQPSDVFDERYWKRTEYDQIQTGLLPNPSTRAYESTLYYDVNQANLEQDADLLGFSLIGYRPRDYLALADLTDITQINVYKNLIKEKGTLNAANAFKGARLPQGGIDYNIYENWAIKLSDFGGTLNSNFAEFRINEKYMTGNPSIVGLTLGATTPGVQQEIPLYSLFNYGRPIADPNILPTIPAATPPDTYPSAGFVNLNDVKMSAYYYTQLQNAVDKNGDVVPVTDFYVRDYVWLANYLEKWDVFTIAPFAGVISVTNNLNNTVLVEFDKPHNLKRNNLISIINFNVEVDGYYLVSLITSATQIVVQLALSSNISVLTGNGIAVRLQSQRVETPADINSLPLLDAEFVKNTVWVDVNDDGGWAVFRKSINYQYESEVVDPDGRDFGAAVAYADRLGYLISDSYYGNVYRYTYNDLTKKYTIAETLSHDPSFGTTISHNNEVYAISNPLSSRVYVYKLVINLLENTLTELQIIDSPVVDSVNWGNSIAISGDSNWLYVADVDNPTNPNNVYAYRRSAATGLYEFATAITVPGLIASDKFGYAISTDYEGKTLTVGAPNRDYSSTIDNWGHVYVFNRAIQTIEVQYNSYFETAQIFTLGWNPPTVQAAVSAASNLNYSITCSSTAGFNVDDPVIFYGTLPPGSNITPNIVYYIYSILSPTTFTIKTSRTSPLPVTVGTVTITDPVVVSVQSTPIFVSVNGTLVDDSNYAIVDNKLIYNNQTTPLMAGDLITVSGQSFVLAQTLMTNSTPKVGVHFGMDTDLNTFGSELLVGAPFELDDKNNEGAVYRFTNGGAKYGIIIGNKNTSVTAERQVLLNGYLVTIPVGQATEVADAINASKITNVQAATLDGKLVLSLIDNNLSIPNEKLLITPLDNITLGELGITVYTPTQTIKCPHPGGPTQFGSVIKFNEQDSVVISAPAGTRYVGTTFDFTDDETLTNKDQYDTIFDNNSTQFVDSYPNAGSVYMFDYLPIYAESVTNPGQFVYAQHVSALNQNFGNQPLYGHAVDFNDSHVIVGTPHFKPGTINGQAIIYKNITGAKDWSVYRSSAPVVDVRAIQNAQLFSAESNNTLINLDYFDPLQGKLLGAIRENLDYVSDVDPAYYNNPANANTPGLVWGTRQVGQLWFNTSNVKFINYHQNDVVYNSRYWGAIFPTSQPIVCSWVMSNVPPISYAGPGTPLYIDAYAVESVLNAENTLTPVYFFWVRNTSIVFQKTGKTLADTTLESYITNPNASGISYFAPLLPNVFAIYNSSEYINANDSVFHVGFSTGTSDDIGHQQYNLIRANFADDFLPGVPNNITTTTPESLYDRLLDSLCGVDEFGEVVPNPYLPKAVQYGILARPRQSFFINRFVALQNYLHYANTVLAQYPITEIKQLTFLYKVGADNPSLDPSKPFYNTPDYWEFINWWAEGYNDNTKATIQVQQYADLATLNVLPNTIVSVALTSASNSETYIYQVVNNVGSWVRIGLTNGTIKFKSSLWDYATARYGFGDNFFDTTPYDEYPSEETRWIVRSLNEQIYTDELLIHRNKSLILLFEYIQSETYEAQNYLPWLNKTSFIDVTHTIRELKPIEVFQSDNQEFLAGYLNEVKPYHVIIKEFLFKYTGSEVYQSTTTDFDLPAQFDTTTQQFISPCLTYAEYPSNSNEFTLSSSIWSDFEYAQWYNNFGLTLIGQPNYQIATLESYMTLTTNSMVVNNATGFPINGIVTVGTEQISYSFVDRFAGILSGLTRGVNGTSIVSHIPGELIYMDLPAVILYDGGRSYVEPPKVTAYLDPVQWPENKLPPGFVAAELKAIMNLDQILEIIVLNPGNGYPVLPEIIVDPAAVISFSSEAVNTLLSTIQLQLLLLQTGDLVQYKDNLGSVTIGGLVANQWYYVGVLDASIGTIALYTSEINARTDTNRVVIYNTGEGSHTLNLGANAYCITSSQPTRENNATLRFDRTTYNSQVIDWQSGTFYGSFFAGQYYSPHTLTSSSIQLASTQPNIDNVLASSEGVVFEISNVRNNSELTWSYYIRQVESTDGDTDSIKLIPQDGNNPEISPMPNYASGSTTGFYTGMPIKFSGLAIGGLMSDTIYYVKHVLDELQFTISETIDGPILDLVTENVSAAGLQCFVGDVHNQAILTVNYPGIMTVTATQAGTNKLTIPLNSSGTGGTQGFYVGTPVFFTGNVFGGVFENEVYYITTVVDKQTFTISETTDPVMLTVSEIDADNWIIYSGAQPLLNINEPIIFNEMFINGVSVTAFGGIQSGQTYYVAATSGSTAIQISETINGSVVTLTTVAAEPVTIDWPYASPTRALLTSQKNTLPLTTKTGTMTINVSLPVSPGQVNGQLFTLYETSGQYTVLTSINNNIIDRTIVRTIGGSDPLDPLNYRAVIAKTTGGLDNLYINMPFSVSTNIGGLVHTIPYTRYYIKDMGYITVDVTGTSSDIEIAAFNATMLGTEMTVTSMTSGSILVGSIILGTGITDNTTVVSQLSGTPGGTGVYVVSETQPSISGSYVADISALTCNTTEFLYEGMPIIFSGDTSSLDGIILGITYYVKYVISANQFVISTTLNGDVFNLTVDNGYIVGTGEPFIVVSSTIGGSAIALINDSGPSILTQEIQNDLVVDASYILGGYRVVIEDAGEGYAVTNTVVIPGSLIGGTSPANDLTMAVIAVDSIGRITNLVCSGTVSAASQQYYLRVISANEFAVYSNKLMTLPVSGIDFPFVGETISTVIGLNAFTDFLTIGDITGFQLNDPVVFTGSVISPFVLGNTYYIVTIDEDTIQVSEMPNGSPVNITESTSGNLFTIAKEGSYMLLPEPIYFNQSIVKFNNNVYKCIISNNDATFVFGKWELLLSSDRELNALDRIIGYYQPTDNMPGVDLTQLVTGITYPNNIYLDSPFAPAEPIVLDTLLQDNPFQPALNIATMVEVWDEDIYFGITNGDATYKIESNTDGLVWGVAMLTNNPINITDLIYTSGIYLATAKNAATPIVKRVGSTWSTDGTFIKYGSTPKYAVALCNAGLQLNAIYDDAGTYYAVGSDIVKSSDGFEWTEIYKFTNVQLTNEIHAITKVNVSGFTGFVVVGSSQAYDYSTGITQIVPTNLIMTSVDGSSWTTVAPVNTHTLYDVTYSPSSYIVAVGAHGTILVSLDGVTWTDRSDPAVTEDLYGVSYYNGMYMAVGQNGRIMHSLDGWVWIPQGIITVTQTTSGLNVMTCDDVSGLQVNQQIRFISNTTVFGGVEEGVAYYVKTIDPLLNTITLSASISQFDTAGPTLDLVDDSGTMQLLTTSTLRGIIYSVRTDNWIAYGDNSTIEIMNGASMSVVNSNMISFVQPPDNYNVEGSPFLSGYGPEELVPGIITDTVTMAVTTRPGINWPETIYGHSGYYTKSKEITPTTSIQVEYYFGDISETPIDLTVAIIDGTTGLSQEIYSEFGNYEIDWVNRLVILATPLPFNPVPNRLRIDAYEPGNGYQIIKSNSHDNPVRFDTATGWNEVYLNCNYIGLYYEGSGVIRPDTSIKFVNVIATTFGTNTLTCESVTDFILNNPVTFASQTGTFGGIVEGTTYYIKTVDNTTNLITVSDTVNPITGVAGPTYILSDAVGSMDAVIAGNQTWADPLVYSNGQKLVYGTSGIMSKTTAGTNAIETPSTSTLSVGITISFCNAAFGGVQPHTQYKVLSIINSSEFTIEDPANPGVEIILDSALGSACWITNDYAFRPIVSTDFEKAKIVFVNPITNADYIAYIVFGESPTIQYNYSLPETQVFEGDGSTSLFDLNNYLGGVNVENAVVQVDGIRQPTTTYTIDPYSQTLSLISPPAANISVSITTFNDTSGQYLTTDTTNTVTVADITYVRNNIHAVIASSNINQAIGPTTNALVADDVYGFVEGQTVILQSPIQAANTMQSGKRYQICTLGDPETNYTSIGAITGNVGEIFTYNGVVVTGTGTVLLAEFGGLSTLGQVYYIDTIDTMTNQFTVRLDPDPLSPIVVLSNDTGSVIASVGGEPTIRITTGVQHNLVDNDLIRIDGVLGSVQLNNKLYYAKVINNTALDIYLEPYNPAYQAANFPVLSVSSYTSGGFIWKDGLFTLTTTNTVETSSGDNVITVTSTNLLVAGTPVYFAKAGVQYGEPIIGGLIEGKEYYISEILSATTFNITEVRDGPIVELISETKSVAVTQWAQTDVDRVWVTINGYRVPSSSLKINPENNLSILSTIVPGDDIIITNMIPTATPEQDVLLLNVNQTNIPVVHRVTADSSTWLIAPLYYENDTIYLQDISKITNKILQYSMAPAADLLPSGDNIMYIGLNADKRIISSVTVFNITRGTIIDPAHYNLVVKTTSPMLAITVGTWISEGDSLEINIIEGNMIYINGEYIRFSHANFVNNTLTGLQRGSLGTGEQRYISKYATVYGLLSINQMNDIQYNKTWNSYVYNQTLGDPLQISLTDPAEFLRGLGPSGTDIIL